MLTKSSVIFPAVVASAASSNGFIFAKNSSTSAALLVSAPKSIKLSPNENNPSGILNYPDPIPAMIDKNVLGSLSSSNIFSLVRLEVSVANEVPVNNLSYGDAID